MIVHTAPVSSLLLNGTRAFATLWRISLRNGSFLRFTDHDRSIDYDIDGTGTAQTFDPVGGFTATAHEKIEGFQESNFDTLGAITDDAITEEDLRAGFFDNAKVEELVVDWRAPYAGEYSRDVWWITSLNYDGERWNAQLSSLMPWLLRRVGRVYTRTCGWNLGEFNATTGFGCHYDTTSNRESFSVASVAIDRLKVVTDLASSVDATGELFVNGYVEWLAPTDAVGIRSPIKAQSVVSGDIALEFFVKVPLTVTTSWDGYVYPGCDRTVGRCKTLGQFPARFGGFNLIPGTKKAINTPNARQ